MKKNDKIRIAYIVENIFTERDCKRFFIMELEQCGFEVLIIDISKIFNPDIDKLLIISPRVNKSLNIVYCNNILDFYKAIRQFKPNYCLRLFSPALKAYFKRLILSIFLKLNTKVIEFNIVNLPFNSNSFSFKKVFRFLLFIPWIFIKPSFSYVTNQRGLSISKGKPILMHEFDYDLYLKSINHTENFKGEPYLLFLDEDCPFHSDFIYQGITNPCTPEVYYKEVNNVLQILSDNLKLNAIVQLHPRANFERSRKFYDKVISEKSTADAIRDASLIVGHASTAIQLAVLFKKPIILIKTKQYEQLNLSYNLILNFQKLLKCTSIWASEASRISSLPIIDESAYEAYESIYTKISGTPKKYSYEIFAHFLNKENNI